MNLLSTLTWILKCVFTCNHSQTEPKEGKCYCPQCGQGVIFQWVVLRCEACAERIDSQTELRQLVPARRCCPQCGERAFRYNYLESPSYFQLRKARFIIREEADVLQGRYHWSVYAFGEHLGQSVGHTIEEAIKRAAQITHHWLTTQDRLTPALITVQSQRPS